MAWEGRVKSRTWTCAVQGQRSVKIDDDTSLIRTMVHVIELAPFSTGFCCSGHSVGTLMQEMH